MASKICEEWLKEETLWMCGMCPPLSSNLLLFLVVLMVCYGPSKSLFLLSKPHEVRDDICLVTMESLPLTTLLGAK